MRPATQTWLQASKPQAAAHLLRSELEIPDWAVLYHPDCYISATYMMDSKALDNQVLHGEKSLMFHEANFIKQRISENDKINVIDLCETSGTSALPFIYELVIEDEIMGTYVPATPNEMVNKVAVKNLRNYFLHSKLFDPNKKEFKHTSITRNFNLENARDLIDDINSEYKTQRFCNLFLLLNSAFGNSENPDLLLRNIYSSMSDQDFLVIIQGIYNRGSESALLADYISWVNDPGGFMVMKDITSIFNDDPEMRFQVKWSEARHGIQVFAQSTKYASMFGIDIEPDKDVTLFRSARFTDQELKQMFETTGFRILNISYDDTMDTAMYFLKK